MSSKLWGNAGRLGEGKAPACPGFSAGWETEGRLLYLGWEAAALEFATTAALCPRAGSYDRATSKCGLLTQTQLAQSWTSSLTASYLTLLGNLQILSTRQTVLLQPTFISITSISIPFPCPCPSHHLPSPQFQCLDLSFTKFPPSHSYLMRISCLSGDLLFLSNTQHIYK